MSAQLLFKSRPQVAKICVITTADVWALHGDALKPVLAALESHVLFFPGGEPRKRLAEVEAAGRADGRGGRRTGPA